MPSARRHKHLSARSGARVKGGAAAGGHPWRGRAPGHPPQRRARATPL